MIAIDTNLLVYAHREAAPEHRAARLALEHAAGNRAGWGIPSAAMAEFWSVVTHAASAGRASRPEQARKFIVNLLDAGAKPLYSRSWERIADLAVELDVRGARIFDLQIALACLDSGARELWTHDRNFTRVPGLEIHDPL